MKILKSLFASSEFRIKGFVLRYEKMYNEWQVIQGNKILYIGDEDNCRMYINTMSN